MNISRFSLWIIGFYTFVSGIAKPSRAVAFSFLGERLLVIFGWHGNCTRGHVFHFQWNGFSRRVAWGTLTYRSPRHRETTIYVGPCWHLFWFNSAHLARWFGKFHDTDFGGYWRWRGHMDM